jgi:hypothetical protein
VLQLVDAIAHNQGDRFTACRAYKERQQVTCGAISPLTVLHDEHQGLGSRTACEQRHYLLEQPRLRRFGCERGRDRVAAQRQLGQQCRQLMGRGPGSGLELVRVPLAHERAERHDDWSVRKLSFGERHALADRDPHVAALSTTGKLGDQTALAHARLCGHEHDRSVTLPRPCER